MMDSSFVKKEPEDLGKMDDNFFTEEYIKVSKSFQILIAIKNTEFCICYNILFLGCHIVFIVIFDFLVHFLNFWLRLTYIHTHK